MRKGFGLFPLIARLVRDEAGSYLLYATLLIPVVIGVAGLGTEGSLIFYNHRTLQSAADAAAYSAAVAYSNDATADITAHADAIFKGYGYAVGACTDTTSDQANVCATTTTFSGLSAIQVTASRPQTRFFSKFWINNSQPNPVGAIAVISGSGNNGVGNCLLALGNTTTSPPANAADAIQLQGNPTVNVPGCGVYSNSNDCTNGSVAIALGGSATINAGSLGSAGCVSVGGSSSINLPGGGTYTQNDGTLSDPYKGTPLPSSPAPPCVPQPAGNLTPGRYCGLNITGTNVSLAPGTYILDCSASTCPTSQGTTSMLIVKNAALTDTLDAAGNGVTLVFDCSSCSSASQWPSNGMLVAANGSVSLSAGTNGFVMMGDSTMPLNTIFDTHSNPNVSLTGTAYVPNGFFEWGGNPATGAGSCLELIANKVTLYGDSAFGGTGCSGGGGSHGAGKPIGSVVTLVQ